MEDTTLLSIEQTEMMKDYLERVSRKEFFVKMDYLCRHKVFSQLQMITVSKLAKEMIHSKCTVGDYIMKKGDFSDGLYILIRGSVTIVYKEAQVQETQSPKNKQRQIMANLGSQTSKMLSLALAKLDNGGQPRSRPVSKDQNRELGRRGTSHTARSSKLLLNTDSRSLLGGNKATERTHSPRSKSPSEKGRQAVDINKAGNFISEKMKPDQIFGGYFVWKDFGNEIVNPKYYKNRCEYSIVTVFANSECRQY